WKQAGVLIPGLKGGLGFGDSVATSADGRFALVGAPRNEHKLGAVLAYGPNPTIEMLEPNSGPVSGGTQVLVVGSNLEGVERIMFGSMPGTAMIAISSRELAIVSPPGTGTVDVTVTTPRGTSPVNENASFTYGKRGNSKGGGGAEEEGGAVAGVGGSPQGQGAVLGSTTTSAAACAVSLHSRGLRVTGRGSAAVQLRFTGAARCSGTLRLLVRVRNAKHRLVAKAIGTSAFALAGTRSHTFAVKLNALGRRLLRHGHGKLSARLTILRVTPSPRTAHTATVKLARPKPKPRPTTTR
ncbi:MAG TPA: IPT/TIG domain-containing protein, partial [Solirubrobacteraceae bacterium]|nr:IPT/TIG domain-containing protein [Solirubrobacteraceae bacterium]